MCFYMPQIAKGKATHVQVINFLMSTDKTMLLSGYVFSIPPINQQQQLNKAG